MPNIAKVLREEISRLARKEVRQETSALRRDSARLKRDVADLKRQVADLQRERRFLQKNLAVVEEHAKPASDVLQRMRVTGRMMAKLRSRLGLTQTEMAELLGVSAQQVYQYERKTGSLRLRNETRATLIKVRQMGKRDARRALEG